jgi:lysophospholipase L1-like esterase
MNILVVGDSIPAGFYDYDKGGWVMRLRTAVMDPKKNIQVYDRSMSGDTTEGVLKRLEINCQSVWPNIIVFQIGGNDAIYAPSTKTNWISKEQFRKNLVKLIKIARKHTDNIIFTDILHVDEKVCNPWAEDEYYFNKYGSEYNKIIQESCKKEKVRFLSMSDLISAKLLDDGLHPNAKGHQKIFEIVRDYLKKEKWI